MIRFIATDLDGTLLTHDKKISQFNQAAIHKAQEKGVIIALASGRGEASLRNYAEQLDMHRYGGYLICNNGQKIISLRDNGVIDNPCLNQDLVVRIFQFAKIHGLELIMEGDDGTSVFTPRHMTVMRFVYQRFSRFLDSNGKYGLKSRLNLFGITQERSINKITHAKEISTAYFKIGIAHSQQRLNKIIQLLNEEFNKELEVFRVNDTWIDLVAAGVSKALGVKQILDLHAIAVNESMAIGDSENDIDMLRFAGIGVAVANAMPSVLAMADEVTASNENDGVAAVILKHI